MEIFTKSEKRRLAAQRERLIGFSAITFSLHRMRQQNGNCTIHNTERLAGQSNNRRSVSFQALRKSDQRNPFYRYDPQQMHSLRPMFEACQNVQVNETLSNLNWEGSQIRA